MERREPTESAAAGAQLRKQDEAWVSAKPYWVDKREVWRAYQQVRTHGKAAGVDGVTLQGFERDVKPQLYKLWNRLSSGSYFPEAVKRVEIPKASGGTRPLGIPTVLDRIAQTVVKQRIEPILEAIFDADSYGYRANRSAHDALRVTRERCWRRPWVLELDIKGYFDSIPHDKLLLAVDKHVSCRMSRLYIRRWLAAGVLQDTGEIEVTDSGTPQGGVVSPLLANLYLHYAFDRWLRVQRKDVQFVRYADDVVCHCRSRAHAEQLKQQVRERLAACGLTLHEDKTRIVYCGESKQHGDVARSFDFLGYQFRLRPVQRRDGKIMTAFTAAISRRAIHRIQAEFRAWRFSRRVQWSLEAIAEHWNVRWRGWLLYYGCFGASGLHALKWRFDQCLAIWWSRKRAIRFSKAAAKISLARRIQSHLFTHWARRGRADSVRAV